MKLSFIVVFVGTLAIVAGQTKYCCVPDQLEGEDGGTDAFVTDGKSISIEETIGVSYDYQNKKQASRIVSTTQGTTTRLTVIEDFTVNKQWIIRGPDCTTNPLQGPMIHQCIPGSAIPTGGNYYYGVGTDKLEARAYILPGETTVTKVAVTRRECLPIAFENYGVIADVPTFKNFGFVNITLGIKDQNVFVPPASCKQKSRLQIPSEIQEIMKRQSRRFFGLIQA